MNSKIRIGINGFGRIGRSVFRLLLQNTSVEVVAVNDPAPGITLAHLLKYDSIHGKINQEVSCAEGCLLIGGKNIPLMHATDPSEIDWRGHQVGLVVESSGKFKTRKSLEQHLKRGAGKVILSVPPEDPSIKMIVLGVNDHILDGSEDIISNASCTTNNAAPMLKVLHDLAEVKQAYITTVHSYTTDQSLHDQPHKDLRRARAAGQSIVPTTTGAAKALTTIFPGLSQVIGGCGIRVPVPNGSLTDMTLRVLRDVSIEEVNAAFRTAASGKLRGYLEYTEDPIVSVDINGNTHSCVFDAQMTSVIGGNFVKVIGWYDNEIGYSSRIIDLISAVCNK